MKYVRMIFIYKLQHSMHKNNFAEEKKLSVHGL